MFVMGGSSEADPRLDKGRMEGEGGGRGDG